MDTQPCRPDETSARDLAELDRELEARREPEIPNETRKLVAGLIAGMTLVGKPREMHRTMERLANAGVSTVEATRLLR